MNKKIKKEVLIIILLIIILIPIVFAVPETLNLQGKLTDSSDNILSGNYNMTFKIYNVYTGGSALWTSANQTISVASDGIYHAILQNINLTFTEQYYLGIAVGTDSEMTPRINLTSVPYSFRTNVTDNLNSTNNYQIQNLTLGEKITFSFGEIIDNIINGIIRITGDLNVTGNSYFKNASFNDGWTSGGVSILGGDIYAQTGYFYNITSLNVTKYNLTVNENIYVQGNIGIGTSTPQNPLNVIGNINVTGNSYLENTVIGGASILGTLRTVTSAVDNNINFDTYDNGGVAPGKQSIINLRRSDSDTIEINDATQNGLALGKINFLGNKGTGFSEGASIYAIQDGAGSTYSPTTLYLTTWTKTAQNTNQLVLNTSGNVGIGTSTPSSLFTTGISTQTNEVNLSGVLYVNSTDREVGIAITNPETNLDVNGSLLVRESTTLNLPSTGKGLAIFYRTDGVQDTGLIQSYDRTNLVGKPLYISFSELGLIGGNVGVGIQNPTANFHLEGLPTTFGDMRFNAKIVDKSPVAIGVGGGIVFSGSYTGTTQTYFAGIWSEKETAVAGNYGTQLHLGTRTHGAQIASRLVIDSLGNIGIGTSTPQNNLNVIGATNSTTGFIVGANTGIADTTSYWLCDTADCSSTCQVQINGGIITGCT